MTVLYYPTVALSLCITTLHITLATTYWPALHCNCDRRKFTALVWPPDATILITLLCKLLFYTVGYTVCLNSVVLNVK
jgi:hypothetical protein